MAFLEELANMMPEPKKQEFLDNLAKMEALEYAETEAAAKQFYAFGRAKRDLENMRKAVRANYADRRIDGAAAQRRRKQMERRKNGN